MKGCLRLLSSSLLIIFGISALLYFYNRWQRVEKEAVVIMRSSNEDCDEFRCIWRIERVVGGNLTATESTSSCYLMNSKREYNKRDSIEWIRVEGAYTSENGQAFYADCIGTLRFWDKTVKIISSPHYQ